MYMNGMESYAKFKSLPKLVEFFFYPYLDFDLKLLTDSRAI